MLYFFRIFIILFSFSDIDDCGGHQCVNGGQCVDGVNEYTCACGDSGYGGQYCADSKSTIHFVVLWFIGLGFGSSLLC